MINYNEHRRHLWTIRRERNAPGWTGPIPWDEAMRLGHFNLDESRKLKPEVRDIVRICADRNVALFFGHATHKEIYKLARKWKRPA